MSFMLLDATHSIAAERFCVCGCRSWKRLVLLCARWVLVMLLQPHQMKDFCSQTWP